MTKTRVATAHLSPSAIALRIVTIGAIAAASLLLVPMTAHAQSYKIIVNNDVALTEIPASVAGNVFLKKERSLPGGTAASPVDLPPSSAVREAFSRAVLGRPASAVVTFWQQQIFSGKETPPPQKGTDAAVLEYVKNTPGGIGYVSEGASTDGVKTVKVK